MTAYASADLLARFNQMAMRPTSDEITDATKYTLLSDAEVAVINEIAARYPDCLYQTGGVSQLSTTDNQVFTFGTDANGDAVAPLGLVGIYADPADVPDCPLVPGVDYLDEGTQIRLPNDTSDAGPLYWRGIATPAGISASSEPTLRPAPARILIVIKAVWQHALDGALRPDLADQMEARWNREFPVYMLNWRNRFRDGGALVLPLGGG